MVMRKTEQKGMKMLMRVTDITPKKEQSGKPIRLAAYCRVSSSSEDQMHSFATQIRYYRDYEKKHTEYELVDIYADEGLTGTCMDKRDELNRMLRDCQRGLIDRIITKSVSRLARNTEDILNIVRMLKSIGVSIYFEEQKLDSSAMNLEMFLTLPGMTAQQESISISQNLRWSNRKRMESGEYKISRPPFGYTIISGQLEVYEPEASIIRRIFDMYLSGIGKSSIAKTLNDEGVRANSEKGYWYYGTVKYILTNERYVGDALLQKGYSTDFPIKKRRNHGELPKYYVEGSNPPIISQETWDAVQKLLNERRGNSTDSRSDNLLHHILKCGDCGWAFIRRVNGDVISWYNRCSVTETHQCSRKRVREEAVYNAFIKLTLKLRTHCADIIDPMIKQMEIIQILTNDNSARISRIDSEINQLSKRGRIISDLYNSGVLNQVEYTAQSNTLNNRLMVLRSERRRKQRDNDETLDELRELRTLLDADNDVWSFDEDLFHQMVKEIIIVSNTELRFRLIGGLEFTEYI